MTTLANINFINVKSSYFHHLEESNILIEDYTKVMEKMIDLKIPSASSWSSIYFTKWKYKDVTTKVYDIKSDIEDHEKKVNAWVNKATEIYFDTNFPPNLDNPTMEANYINQQTFMLNRIDQLLRNIQTLYTSINTIISELRIMRDSAVNARRFQIGILIAIFLFGLDLIV